MATAAGSDPARAELYAGATAGVNAEGAAQGALQGAQSAPHVSRVRFGEFEANFRTRVLSRGDDPVRLQEKPFQVLCALLERAGNVVTREEIRSRVWPDDNSLDFDANLNTALNKLRRALGDVHEQPMFIRTIPRTGYCFVANTSVVAEQAEEAKPRPAAVPARPAGVREPSPAAAARPASAVAAAQTAAPADRPRWAAMAGFGFAALVVTCLALLLLRPYTSWASYSFGGRSLMVVLPFESPGGNAEDGLLAGALTDDLNSRMAGVNPRQLGVIAPSTAAQYRGAHKTAEQIGHELSADYLLEGTVRRDGDRARVFLWLVRTRDQVPVWAETYDRGSKDMLALEDSISSHVTAVLAAKFFGKTGEVAEESAPANPAAHEDYLKGRYFWNRLASTDLEKALTLYQSAIEKDPSYAEAYAGVAETYAVLADWTLRPPAETLPAARESARRALDHDSSLAEAHAVLGLVAWQYDHDWPQAEAEFSNALRLSPSNATVHQWHGEYLASVGRLPEANAEMERARQLDPLSRFIATDIGYTAYLARDYDRAIAAFRSAMELDPDFYGAHLYLYWTFLEKGMGKEAAAELQRLLVYAHAPQDAQDSFRAASASGDLASIHRWILDRNLKRRATTYTSAWRIAANYAALGQKDEAFQWMDKAIEEHDPQMTRLRVDPMLDPLRSDPRFQAYLDRMNLR